MVEFLSFWYKYGKLTGYFFVSHVKMDKYGYRLLVDFLVIDFLVFLFNTSIYLTPLNLKYNDVPDFRRFVIGTFLGVKSPLFTLVSV